MIGIKQFPAIGIYFPEKDKFLELPYNCIWNLKGKNVSRNRSKLSWESHAVDTHKID
jgi:hypothetical protein